MTTRKVKARTIGAVKSLPFELYQVIVWEATILAAKNVTDAVTMQCVRHGTSVMLAQFDVGAIMSLCNGDIGAALPMAADQEHAKLVVSCGASGVAMALVYSEYEYEHDAPSVARKLGE